MRSGTIKERISQLKKITKLARDNTEKKRSKNIIETFRESDSI